MVVSVAVHAGWGNEPGEALEQLEGSEKDSGAPVGRGPREAIEQPGLGRGEWGRAAHGVEAFEGEWGSGTVAGQTLDARTVVTPDADGGIDAEPHGTLPDSPSAGARHALGIGLIEKAARTEVPEDAALNDALEIEPVAFTEQGRRVEADGPVGDRREDAVEDHEVEMEVWVESRPEAVQEGDGAELSIPGRGQADGAKRRADGSQEDVQDGAGDLRIVLQVEAMALG